MHFYKCQANLSTKQAQAAMQDSLGSRSCASRRQYHCRRRRCRCACRCRCASCACFSRCHGPAEARQLSKCFSKAAAHLHGRASARIRGLMFGGRWPDNIPRHFATTSSIYPPPCCTLSGLVCINREAKRHQMQGLSRQPAAPAAIAGSIRAAWPVGQ